MLAACCLLALAACGGSDKPDETTTSASTSAATNPSADLEAAVRNYSSAFLTGDGAAAYALMSERCQDATPLSDFAAITEQAADTYGEVAIKSLKVALVGMGQSIASRSSRRMRTRREPRTRDAGSSPRAMYSRIVREVTPMCSAASAWFNQMLRTGVDVTTGSSRAGHSLPGAARITSSV